MRVLVTAATKHGATREIAHAIADALREQGLDPTVIPPEQVDTVQQLSFPEKSIVSALRVPEGDFRDWSEITGWAAGIATALRSRSSSAEAGHDDHAG
jgi:hypothetical protein